MRNVLCHTGSLSRPGRLRGLACNNRFGGVALDLDLEEWTEARARRAFCWIRRASAGESEEGAGSLLHGPCKATLEPGDSFRVPKGGETIASPDSGNVRLMRSVVVNAATTPSYLYFLRNGRSGRAGEAGAVGVEVGASSVGGLSMAWVGSRYCPVNSCLHRARVYR